MRLQKFLCNTFIAKRALKNLSCGGGVNLLQYKAPWKENERKFYHERKSEIGLDVFKLYGGQVHIHKGVRYIYHVYLTPLWIC